MSSTPGTPAYEIPGHVLLREVDGEMVLLNLESEQYYGLDAVGAHMVTAVTQLSRADALASLRSDYAVDAEILERDLDDLVGKLLDVGLLTPLNAG